jgi:hypothetical protein
MRFNGDTNGDDIVTLTNDLVSTNNTVFSLAEKARSASRISRRIWSYIFEAYGGWQFDDIANTTDFPRARASTVAGQQSYTLPSQALTIRSLEMQDASGDFYNLVPVTEEEIKEVGSNEVDFQQQGGRPAYYQPIGDSFKLYPTPTTTGSQNIRISFDRGIIGFLPTDTTKTPAWDTTFHEMLAVGMALDWATKHPSDRTTTLTNDFNQYVKDIKRLYQARYKEKYPPKLRVRDNMKNYQ